MELPVLRGHLPANTGPPFRRASANLPQTLREIRQLLWSSWLAFALPVSVSCTQQRLSASAAIVSPRTHTETNNFISTTKLPQTFRERIPSAKPSAKPSACFRACGAVRILNRQCPSPYSISLRPKKRRSVVHSLACNIRAQAWINAWAGNLHMA